jgi:hypothetical protein
MWKKLLELMSKGDTDQAVEAVKLFKAEDFELSVEINTAMMTDIYEAATTRKKFSRIADTIAGHQSGRDKNAWLNTAFNLDPTSGNSSVARSYNR